VQQQAVKDEVHKKFPLILTSGRLVEYEGGGEETRSNPWLAELQQDAYIEINPKTAADRSIRNGEYVWLSSPGKNPSGGPVRLKVKAKVTEGVGADTIFMPFHFSGWWRGHAALLPGGGGADRAGRSGQHGHYVRLRPHHADAGNQDHAVPSGKGLRRQPWRE
jgi:formate dehydrogenase major subunit